MGKERRDSFMKIYSKEESKKILREEKKSKRLERRTEKLFDSAQERVDKNKKKFDSFGIKDLFEQIKLENKLGSQVQINEGISLFLSEEKIKEHIKKTLANPIFGKSEAEDEISRWIDAHSFISLSWDYTSPPLLNDDITVVPESMKHISVGILEDNPYLKFSTENYKEYKAVGIGKGNLDRVISRALLIQAKKTPGWDFARQVYH
jgi:hypothetical protein